MNTTFSAFQTRVGRFARLTLAAVLLAAVLFGQGSASPASASNQTDIHGPTGSGKFGQQVTVLPNGNIVVIDPNFNAPGSIANVGAVYLYNGASGALISTLTGSTAGDMVGCWFESGSSCQNFGVTVLSNGNFLVVSPYWHNYGGAVTWENAATGVNGAVSAANSLVGSTISGQVGWCDNDPCITQLSNGNYVVNNNASVTWGNGATGVSGAVSAANSLVGTTTNDGVGDGGVTALSNGNYVVKSPDWPNGSVTEAGAVTWGNGAAGTSGVVSSTNSLVGTTTNDRIGFNGVTVLSNSNYVIASYHWNSNAGAVTWGSGATGVSGVVSAANSLVGSSTGNNGDSIGSNGVYTLNNGNYVVVSTNWSNGATAGAGAVTWGNGATGVNGTVSAANSLVGSTAWDQVGYNAVTTLSNGDYVVASSHWNNDTGAVTWGNGATGVSGLVSSTNSLVGSKQNDEVGSPGVTVLSNDNYVVASSGWNNNSGAVTWANGAAGVKGTVSKSNSLVGPTGGDQVGSTVTALSNGNYVVASPNWINGSAYGAGAVTLANGATGTTGTVSKTNSLIGTTDGDYVGEYGMAALTNGNYVVMSPSWHNGSAGNAGAATWGNGTTGTSGAVSKTNSLVGSTAGDRVGSMVITLTNGNYVVGSQYWHNGAAAASAGEVTWGNGATGTSGVVSASNSLVGSTANDQVGSSGMAALSNSNYVVLSPFWDKGATADAGAATWGNGATGVSGVISAANSLVGATADDQVGVAMAMLSNGDYIVSSPYWDNSATVDAGAITLGAGAACTAVPATGPITSANSVLGTAASGGSGMNFAYDPIHQQLVVGRPADNIVTLFAFPCGSVNHVIFLPVINK